MLPGAWPRLSPKVKTERAFLHDSVLRFGDDYTALCGYRSQAPSVNKHNRLPALKSSFMRHFHALSVIMALLPCEPDATALFKF